MARIRNDRFSVREIGPAILKRFIFLTGLLPRKNARNTKTSTCSVCFLCDLCVLLWQFIFGCRFPRFGKSVVSFLGRLRASALPLASLALVFLAGCLCRGPGAHEKRKGDEIVVAGRFFHTGTPVVLWADPGGYDARRGQNPEQPDAARGMDLPTLQSNVDQFVLHFDAAGTSRTCFKVLQERGLSVHFMLDLDGVIYQTLDLKERARHATIANDRSIGVEIANIGAYAPAQAGPLSEWYKKGMPMGAPASSSPCRFGPSPERTPGFMGWPARRQPARGRVQGKELCQYDFTPAQYRALAKLTTALCAVFPRITCDYPRDAAGN